MEFDKILLSNSSSYTFEKRKPTSSAIIKTVYFNAGDKEIENTSMFSTCVLRKSKIFIYMNQYIKKDLFDENDNQGLMVNIRV